MPISFVRHGPVMVQNTCYGQINVPTAMKANEAITVVRQNLEGHPQPAHVWSSPLTRCLELAQVFSDGVRTDPRLMETSFGVWEGLTWDDVHAQFPNEMAEWGRDWIETPPPGGESARALRARLDRFIETLGLGHHLVFSHAGVIRAARVSLGGMTWHQAMEQPVPYLSVETFWLPSEDGLAIPESGDSVSS